MCVCVCARRISLVTHEKEPRLTVVHTLQEKCGVCPVSISYLLKLLCVRAKGIHLLLISKSDQIAVPGSSRMAAVRVVNLCFVEGETMKESLFSVTCVS